MSESHLHYPQQPFRIGVVGTGSMGKNHARIFGELKDSHLSAILDERAEVAQEIAAKYQAKASANLDEFTESVDAATIATPTVTHFAIAKHLLEHGKDEMREYSVVLSRYVQMATAAGVTQAIFPEGGLTVDGRLRAPRFGLLDYMLKSFDPAGGRRLSRLYINKRYALPCFSVNLAMRCAP